MKAQYCQGTPLRWAMEKPCFSDIKTNKGSQARRHAAQWPLYQNCSKDTAREKIGGEKKKKKDKQKNNYRCLPGYVQNTI